MGTRDRQEPGRHDASGSRAPHFDAAVYEGVVERQGGAGARCMLRVQCARHRDRKSGSGESCVHVEIATLAAYQAIAAQQAFAFESEAFQYAD